LHLPLTAEGVFGEGLEDKLEKRKERSEQLKELLPEFSNTSCHLSLESKFFNLFERLSKKLLMFVPVLYCRWTMKSPNHRFYNFF
jgi:hypothetical protein